MKSIVPFFALLLWASAFYAQTPQAVKKGMYFDSNHHFYMQASLPLYLYVTTDTTEIPQLLTVTQKNKPVRKAMYMDGHGLHHIKHWDTENRVFEDFEVYADGEKPITKSVAQYDYKAITDSAVYYGKNLAIKLTPSDEMAGLKSTFYSMNGEGFEQYTTPFGFSEEGSFNIKYYSVDMVGNVEDVKEHKFTVDLIPPETNFFVLGTSLDTVLSIRSIIQLEANDNISGVKKLYYRIDAGKWTEYNSKKVPLQDLEDDHHTLEFYAEDLVGNAEKVKQFEFFLDRTAPLASLIALGDKYVIFDKVYYSGRTKLILIALDNKAGLKQIKYSIDNGKFEDYKDAFYLPSSDGEHAVKYFAIDKLDNQGIGEDEFSVYEHMSDKFFIDLLGPSLGVDFIGPVHKRNQRVFVCNRTKMKIFGTDESTGIKSMAYLFDTDLNETVYDSPILLPFDSGLHVIKAIAYDNVNNRNMQPVIITADNEGPEIKYYFSVDKVLPDTVSVVPSYSKVYLAAYDELTGTERIDYSLDQGPWLYYRKPIAKLEKNKEYELRVKATDKLGNISDKIIRFRTID